LLAFRGRSRETTARLKIGVPGSSPGLAISDAEIPHGDWIVCRFAETTGGRAAIGQLEAIPGLIARDGRNADRRP
jgi:hypothetical protein